jgi:prolyl-tRNA synthetase
VSWRMLGGLIMVHGDDRGLVLPPQVAPVQAVIVPILAGKAREEVLSAARGISASLTPQVRTRLDDRAEVTPGWKFNDWEMRGVPLRIEVGPRDLAQRQAILVPRIGGEKRIAPLGGIAEAVSAALADVKQTLARRSKAFLDSHIVSAATLEEVVAAIAAHRGFVRLQWCGEDACEVTLRRESGASPRLIAEDAPAGGCAVCGNRSRHVVYYARAY